MYLIVHLYTYLRVFDLYKSWNPDMISDNEAQNKANASTAKKTLIEIDPRKVISISDYAGVSETEIAADITVPEEGGWGWVVVASSFMCLFILDGTFFTFGSIYKDISEDIDTEVSLVALINSVAIALYFITGPIVSALINRFGFRSCAMTGSIIVSLSYIASYFAESYILILLFYGVIPGFGGCFINMSSQLVVGFYFERLRALAMAIAGLGQSLGIMIMSPVNTYFTQTVGWRTTTLFHSGLFGMIYFIAMAYRPLLSLTVTHTIEDARTVTYLPSLSTMSIKTSFTRTKEDSKAPASATERLFSAVSNAHFPTAAEVLEEHKEKDDTEPGPSFSGVTPKITLKARSPQGGISHRHFKQVQSIMSPSSDKEKIAITVTHVRPHLKKPSWWARCCHWETHIDESRPMYRDDAFYVGKLHKLPVYQKHMTDVPQDKKISGLEYHMAVSRTVTAVDLTEPKGIFTTAVRRILATMMDPKLLRRCSFLMVCTTGFLTHVGILVPYIFVADRNRSEGIDPKHCNLFVCVIGFSNALGKLIAGLLAYKFNPIRIYSIACIMAGTGTIVSNFSFNFYYQYFCCVIFGISAAHMSTLRSLVIVDLYGLENLTNATGMLLMFQGFGILLSTPLSSVLKNNFGYIVSFYVAGTFIVLGGFVIACVKKRAVNEVKAAAKLYSKNTKRVSIQRRVKKEKIKNRETNT